MSLPGIMSEISESVISLKRLRAFFDRQEIGSGHVHKKKQTAFTGGINVINASFEHYKADKDEDAEDTEEVTATTTDGDPHHVSNKNGEAPHKNDDSEDDEGKLISYF